MSSASSGTGSRASEAMPSTVPRIAEPCAEAWDEMSGGHRVRRCTRCNHDVHNLAALSGEEVAHLLAQPGPLPCMRITTYEDGTLMTTEPRVSSRRVPLLAVAAISSAMAFGAAAAQSAGETAVTGHHPAYANLAGHVTDPSGRPVSGASVLLMRHDIAVAHTRSAADGSYALEGKPGEYQLVVDGPTLITQTLPVRLVKHAPVDLTVRIAAATDLGLGTTLGVPAMVTPLMGKVSPPRVSPKKGSGLRR